MADSSPSDTPVASPAGPIPSRDINFFTLGAESSPAHDEEVAEKEEVEKESPEVETKEAEESEDGAADATEEESTEESEQESASDTPPPEGEATKRARPIIFKQGDEKIKVRPDARITVTVNGKDEEVTVSDLRNSYSSKSALKEEYLKSKAEREKVAQQSVHVEAERREMEAWVKHFATRVKKKDEVIPAIVELLEPFSEQDGDTSPLAIVRSIRSGILEQAQAFLQLTEAERRTLEVEEENAYLRYRQKKSRESQNKNVQNQQILVEIEKVMKEVSIPSLDVFEHNFNDLQQLQKAEAIKVRDITPKHVGEFFSMRAVVHKVSPKLLTDEKAMGRLFSIKLEFEPTTEELEQVIRGYVSGSDRSEATPEKSKKTPLSNKPKLEKSNGTKPKSKRELFL
jgi:hypothetical protein